MGKPFPLLLLERGIIRHPKLDYRTVFLYHARDYHSRIATTNCLYSSPSYKNENIPVQENMTHGDRGTSGPNVITGGWGG
jgi:hypothetical protein